MAKSPEAENAMRMLDGCVCRLNITDDFVELQTRRDWAKFWIDRLYDENKKRLHNNA